MKMVCLNFLYPAAARGAKFLNTVGSLMRNSSLSSSSAQEHEERGEEPAAAMLSAGGQLSGRVRSALDFFLVINFILLVFLSSLAVYQVQHLFMGRVLVLCLTFAVSWLDSSSDILV